MISAPLAPRVRDMWQHLAGPGACFQAVPEPVVSPESRICPPGWAGIVTIAGQTLLTVPHAAAAELARSTAVPAHGWTDPAVLRHHLPIVDTLGPAQLAYLDPATFQPHPGHGDAAQIAVTDPTVGALLAEAGADDADESGLADVTSPVFALLDQGRITAAAGYRQWPGEVAHLSVLTAPEDRHRGLARQVASAAVAHAIAAGQLPQWRARPAPSRRVAQSLGFQELGAQLSIQLAA